MSIVLVYVQLVITGGGLERITSAFTPVVNHFAESGIKVPGRDGAIDMLKGFSLTSIGDSRDNVCILSVRVCSAVVWNSTHRLPGIDLKVHDALVRTGIGVDEVCVGGD